MSKIVGSRRFAGNARLIFSLLTAAILGALFLTGCGKDDKSSPAGNDRASLICEDGEAWVDPPPSPYGMVLQDDGTLIIIQLSDDRWIKMGVGTWSANGNQLTISGAAGNSQTFTYSVSGNTLTVDQKSGNVTRRAISTKKSGIYYEAY